MMDLLREDAGDKWTFGHPADLATHARTAPCAEFDDEVAAAQWLRAFDDDALRRLAGEALDLSALSRTTDRQLVDRLAAMLVTGELCAVSGSADSGQARSAGWTPTVEDRILRRLRNTSRNFQFESDRLRIVNAREWASLHGSDEPHLRVLPQEQARSLMRRVATRMQLSVDEAQAIEEAIALVPAAWHPDRATSGILLIHVLDRAWNRPRAGSNEAVASAPARGRKAAEDHWFELALIDDEDQPVAGQAYRIELPGGEIREGRLDAQGIAHIAGLSSAGNCKVCFPDIDSTEWRAA